jgi:quinohemoprotein amine dehydrogenase
VLVAASKSGRRSPYNRIALFVLLAVLVLLNCSFGWIGVVSGQVQPVAEEGIPVTDSLVIAKCKGCHPNDDRGNMKRISWERATPEGWELAIQRMTLIDDVDLTPSERQHVLQYLNTHHGLAPEEANTVAYDVERRIHEEEVGVPRAVTTACARCHNFARALSWRRSVDDWREFSRTHALRYNFQPSEEAIAFLAKTTPLRSPEWSTWNSRPAGKSLAGRWLVTASVLGRIRYFGEMQMEPTGTEGEFNTRATLRSVADGSTVQRVGHGTMYGAYAWRGVSKGADSTTSTPDGLSNEAREVLTSTQDESSAEGRWFWGQYQELGFDIKIQRAPADATLLGIDRPLLKTGSQANRIRLFGDHLPAQIAQKDLDLGSGVTVRRIVSSNANEIVAEVDVALKAPVGRRKIGFRRSVLANALAVFDRVDYIKVMPESSLAAFGEPTRNRGYQQFEAIGYLNGPDGKRHSDDDIELGPVDVNWSIKIFYENEGRTDGVGVMTPTGLFVPNANSPKNNFDVWVIAEAKTDKDQDGLPLVGKGYLVVTVPVYVFNGRRYVREFDRWVDDGPAQPAR